MRSPIFEPRYEELTLNFHLYENITVEVNKSGENSFKRPL